MHFTPAWMFALSSRASPTFIRPPPFFPMAVRYGLSNG